MVYKVIYTAPTLSLSSQQEVTTLYNICIGAHQMEISGKEQIFLCPYI